MRRTTTCCARQLLSSIPFRPVKEIPQASPQCLRSFSKTKSTAADDTNNLTAAQLALKQKPDIDALTAILKRNQRKSAAKRSNGLSAYDAPRAGELDYSRGGLLAPGFPKITPIAQLMSGKHGLTQEPELFNFHIYATKHNTHITVTNPERNPLISVSCGNIGFRKAGRKHYDSAYQLAGYVIGQMAEKGITHEITTGPGMAVVLRGFGAGREAVTKALLGAEGRFLRDKIKKVADSTRLKFGGSRSRKPRRLG